tara:strand:- start:12380 stop:12589 length:210 start_codon:yes stop_codon:yes gene_type:complete
LPEKACFPVFFGQNRREMPVGGKILAAQAVRFSTSFAGCQDYVRRVSGAFSTGASANKTETIGLTGVWR